MVFGLRCEHYYRRPFEGLTECTECRKGQFSSKMDLTLLLKPGQDNWPVSVFILLLRRSVVMTRRGNKWLIMMNFCYWRNCYLRNKPAIPRRPDVWLLRPGYPVLLVLPLAGDIEGIGIVDESLSRGQGSQWHKTECDQNFPFQPETEQYQLNFSCSWLAGPSQLSWCWK